MNGNVVEFDHVLLMIIRCRHGKSPLFKVAKAEFREVRQKKKPLLKVILVIFALSLI